MVMGRGLDGIGQTCWRPDIKLAVSDVMKTPPPNEAITSEI
jgi:hypothetical protein